MSTINNSLINVLSGRGLKPAALPARAKTGADKENNLRGRRALLNFLPDNDTLESLISQARLALSRGIFWDRGSIINIVL